MDVFYKIKNPKTTNTKTINKQNQKIFDRKTHSRYIMLGSNINYILNSIPVQLIDSMVCFTFAKSQVKYLIVPYVFNSTLFHFCCFPRLHQIPFQHNFANKLFLFEILKLIMV